MPTVQLFVDNTMNVLLEGLQLEDSLTYVNDASTATLTIYDRAGAVIETITLAYVASSNGNYTGVIPADTALVRNSAYDCKVTAIKDGNQGVWWDTARAIRRPFNQ